MQKYSAVRQLHSASVPMETGALLAVATDVNLEREKKRKAEIAAKRRARIMAQMSEMQKNFIKENAELFESTNTELQTAGCSMDVG